MKWDSSRTLLLILVVGFLIGNLPFVSVAGIFDITHNETSDLEITEPLFFSTLTGNWSYDEINCVDFDDKGNIYAIGNIDDDAHFRDPRDGFLMKIDGTNFSLIKYLSIGGFYVDFINDMIVDSGRVYLVGSTSSINFPVQNAYCDELQSEDSSDCFLMCLNASSLEIIFSTYLGGNHTDTCEALFVDDTGSIFVTGTTNSRNFPMINSYGPFPPNRTDHSAVFVTKFNSTGNGVIYSSIIGGSNDFDGATGIVGDDQGNVYVSGFTQSDDFPTINAYSDTLGGVERYSDSDGFVFCLNSTGNGLLFSTYLGGYFGDALYDIALDSQNDVWVCGRTDSRSFPVVDSFHEFTGENGVVCEFSSNGSTLLFSSIIGCSGYDQHLSMDIDDRDNVYVAGFSQSNDIPQFPEDTSLSGRVTDCLVLKIGPEKSIQYLTYIGGSSTDKALSIAVGKNGAVLVGGVTYSHDFPLRKETSGPSNTLYMYDIYPYISGDGFVFILLDISDEDGDNIPSWWELANGYDPLNPNTPMIELLVWYAPVILTIGALLTLLMVILALGRHRIKSWIGKRTSNGDLPP